MKSLRVVVALCAFSLARTVGAQSTDYVPSHRLPEGREVVAIYIGATHCVPCLSPEVKKAVRAMKPLVAAQAKQQSSAFSAIGVAQDWNVKSGIAFFDSLGAFDQVVVGGNWTNLAIERFVLRDSLTEMAMPQILVVERNVKLGERVSVSEPRVLRRISGPMDITAWVAAGAPITSEKK